MLQSEAWATTVSKTDPSWLSGQTSRHVKASSGKGYISLQQLTLSTFKHVISQVSVISIIGLHPILSMQLWSNNFDIIHLVDYQVVDIHLMNQV
jgi:hypothetical protein